MKHIHRFICNQKYFTSTTNVPCCKDCKYLKVSRDIFYFETLNCSMFGTKSHYNGKMSYESTISCRKNNQLCGTGGAYFKRVLNG